jgi:hypothetical protein
MKQSEKSRLHIHLDPKLLKNLRMQAVKEETNMSEIVVRLIECYLKGKK